MMRLILGIILGAILTTGAAYVHDTVLITPTGTTVSADQRPMVNWDVVQNSARNVGTRTREQFDKLTK